jgi:ABC-type transport system involved in multi-copper enzyme maturation permease subunit
MVELNSDEHISNILNTKAPVSQLELIKLNIVIGLKTLFYGRKWRIFLFLGILPLFFTIFTADNLFGNPDATSAFIDTFIGVLMLFLFVFGCLLMAQPLSTDEIADNMIEYYLVRPIRRESIWISRLIVTIIGIFVVSTIITTIYYLFFNIVDPNNSFSDFFNNMEYLFKAYSLLLFASILYGGVFLLVGFIGNKGFTLGILVAVVESFFLNLLFLQNSLMIPRTHIKNIADDLFSPYYTDTALDHEVSTLDSILFGIVFTALICVLGVFVLRRKQFS